MGDISTSGSTPVSDELDDITYELSYRSKPDLRHLLTDLELATMQYPDSHSLAQLVGSLHSLDSPLQTVSVASTTLVRALNISGLDVAIHCPRAEGTTPETIVFTDPIKSCSAVTLEPPTPVADLRKELRQLDGKRIELASPTVTDGRMCD